MRSQLSRLRTVLLLVTASVLLHGSGARLSAMTPPFCDEVCSSSDCGSTCYIDQFAFDQDDPTTCLDFGTYDIDSWCCGDAICSDVAGENSDTCTDDCGGPIAQEPVCGSNGCELGENCANCSADCGVCSVVTSCNNNDNCEPGETKSCPDCQISGFCKHNSDCPATNGNTYVCVNDTCVLNDLPGYSTTCGSEVDCTSGYKCDYSDQYVCPYWLPHCKVCLPPWAIR